jgi:tRNA (guanine37-N1)-methyltransferase
MQIDTISIFPQIFSALNYSLIGKAKDKNILKINNHNLRDWTTDKHKTVDDTPYGGGAGMIFKPDVIGRALDNIIQKNSTIIIPNPSGKIFNQKIAESLSKKKHLVFVCGRYEGIDHRIVEHYSKENELFELSIGNYVINGGEVASFVIIESTVRLIEGVIGNSDSLITESHNTEGYIEYPLYTKPSVFKGIKVPDVLTSGNHKEIENWQKENSKYIKNDK